MNASPTPSSRPAFATPTTRRAFLKTSALALAAASFTPPLILRGGDPASTAANSKLNVALVGCGGQGRQDIRSFLGIGINIVALCDPDANQIAATHALLKDAAANAKDYTDYRKLLDDAHLYDAVVIATPDHWHAPLATVFLKAGKHVYCEKPLTHTVAEARALRHLAATSKGVTQMGNQGSGSPSMRRCIELIQAGVLGQIHEIHHWGMGYGAKEGAAQGQDPVPAGLNWDLWVGPRPLIPYKANKTYHTYNWRNWYNFGEGSLGDFGCHSLNLPMRALKLGYPSQLVYNVEKGQRIPGKPALEFRFPARGDLVPLAFLWHGGPGPAEIVQPVIDLYHGKDHHGVMIVGEKGIIYTNWWNIECKIRLNGEPALKDVLFHPATASIPKTVPRVKNHYEEFINACTGNGATFSNFEIGGHLTEIVMAGVVAVRTGKSFDWDGEKMAATNAPEAAQYVHYDYRPTWLVT